MRHRGNRISLHLLSRDLLLRHPHQHSDKVWPVNRRAIDEVVGQTRQRTDVQHRGEHQEVRALAPARNRKRCHAERRETPDTFGLVHITERPVNQQRHHCAAIPHRDLPHPTRCVQLRRAHVSPAATAKRQQRECRERRESRQPREINCSSLEQEVRDRDGGENLRDEREHPVAERRAISRHHQHKRAVHEHPLRQVEFRVQPGRR